MTREGFPIGPLFIHFYGVIIMLGVLAASWLAGKEAKRRGLNPEIILDVLPWLLVAGIVGARLWHVFTPTTYDVEAGRTTMFYLTHPLDAINTLNGGLGIPGAVIGGVLALYFFCRKKKLVFLTWADIIMPGLALAQAIGRWGNFVNQEVYGAPSSLPWAIFIEPAHRLPGFETVERYHPLFLYESLWNLLVMGFLLFVGRKFEKRLKPGYLLQFYLILYPAARFLLEFLRLGTAEIGGINANQTTMAVVALSSLAVLIWRETRPRKVEAVEAPGAVEPLSQTGGDDPDRAAE